MSVDLKVNDRIYASVVTVISDDGTNRGNVSREIALSMARDAGLDLIQMSYPDNGDVPVCKIMDYGKYKYWQSKKNKPKHDSVKEIRVHYHTAEHDLGIKHKKVFEFLSKKHQVKYVMQLRGREKYMREEVLHKFVEMLDSFKDVASWTTPTAIVGGQVVTVLNPK